MTIVPGLQTSGLHPLPIKNVEGNEIEIFSNDVKAAGDHRGVLVCNDILSCVQWCKYAEECVSGETYRKLMAMKGG